ncbi:YbaM family protein [Pseudoalteromonas luteoviolacea]|uniref:YbaM family protein n=1 Tax=Pseudoalteromonas luteoviolacea TaxID=43657 RepID=UPI001FFC8D07|nr:YbaM family protein [Pseudoalteromonas luteoviolacea]
MMNKKTSPLDDAPQHVKLAVDLIMLLEQNEVAPKDVLQALEIVKQDFLNKIQLEQKT